MKSSVAEHFKVAEIADRIDGVRVGNITEIDESGQVWIDYPGNQLGPTRARFTGSIDPRSLRRSEMTFQSFLLVFENGDPKLPIIIDVLRSVAEAAHEPSALILETPDPKDVTIDGKRVTFDAKEEIVLRCGKASITLTRAGKVLIRGAYLLSRSSGAHRIKGGSIQLN
jgi:hypothetical protein